jgi:hypothetical protein
VTFLLQPPITDGVRDEMTWTSKSTAQAELGIEFTLIRPDGTEGKFTYPLGLLKYSDGAANYDFDEFAPSKSKWINVFTKDVPAGRLRPSWEMAFDRDDERELAFRISRLLTALAELSDPTNQHHLASGKTASYVEMLLKRFVAANEFPVYHARYDKVPPANLFSQWRKEAEPKTASWIGTATESLTRWDEWIAKHRDRLADPVAIGAALHEDLVFGRWRDSDALPYLDCSVSIPFC